MTCHIQEMTTLAFFWNYPPFLCLNLISSLLSNTNTLWNILMILGRNVEQEEMTFWIQEWQLWLSYIWSYLPFMCLKFSLCLLCNSNTLWIILILPGRNVLLEDMLQEWQLWLSYFWSFSPSCVWIWFHVRSVTPVPFTINWWYLV